MKPVYLCSILSFLLFLSCQDINTLEKPVDLIGEEKMTDILFDLALIDAALSTNRIKASGKGFDPQTYIFSKYNIDSAQLARSNAYYLQTPKINLRMYEKVRDRLQKRKNILDSLKIIEDSLQRKELKHNKLRESHTGKLGIFPDTTKKTLDLRVPKKDTLI